MNSICYVYKLTDKVTGKWYIGSRVAVGCFPDELGVKYFTSSKVVAPLYKDDPNRFKSEIIVQSEDAEYITKVEHSLLKFRNARDDEMSYNAWNGDGKFNAKKAAEITVITKVGVHARTAERKYLDAQMGGRIGGKVTFERKVGIHQRSLEQKQAAGRYASSCMSLEQRREIGRKNGKASKELKTGIHAQTKEEQSLMGKKVAAQKWKCDECELISSAGNIFQHQRACGHRGRTRIG